MLNRLPMLIAWAIFIITCMSPGECRAQVSGTDDNLTGAWQGKVQFSTGAFASVKDLEFMYAFIADGTMIESSNYDAAPPVPPAYGVWKKTAARRYLAKYRFYVSNAVSSAEELVKGGGWAPGGYGVLTETIDLAADGHSFSSKILLELFDKEGKAMAGGGEASASAKRLGF